MANRELYAVLAPYLAERCAAGDVGRTAQACRGLRDALEARLTRLVVARGKRSLASLSGIGGRFPAVHHVTLHVDDVEKAGEGSAPVPLADALAAAAGPAGGWPGVRSLRFLARWARGPLAAALAALVARCPNLEAVEATGQFGDRGGEPAAAEPRPGAFAALAPAAATLQAALLVDCWGPSAADVAAHLGALTRLTCLELSTDSLGLPGWAAAAEALPGLTALEALRLPGPRAGGAATFKPRLEALPRLRELSMLPTNGARALSAALRELQRRAVGGAAALTALTSLSLLHDPDVESRGCGGQGRLHALQGRCALPCLQACELAALPPSPAPPLRDAPPVAHVRHPCMCHQRAPLPAPRRAAAARFEDEPQTPVSAKALSDVCAVAPNLKALELSTGVAPGAINAPLPPSLTRLAIGGDFVPTAQRGRAPRLARAAPGLRALTVWEAPMWAAGSVEAMIKGHGALEEVAFEGYHASQCGYDDLEHMFSVQNLACLGRLPRLRRIALLDGFLLAGAEGQAPARLAGWARGWAGAPLEELRLVTSHDGDPHGVSRAQAV
jgi:hypothetical protein